MFIILQYLCMFKRIRKYTTLKTTYVQFKKVGRYFFAVSFTLRNLGTIVLGSIVFVYFSISPANIFLIKIIFEKSKKNYHNHTQHLFFLVKSTAKDTKFWLITLPIFFGSPTKLPCTSSTTLILEWKTVLLL